mmetsp:Transcript_22756/g.65620  ORF Transcript_22756/g.65620 Transcript_22756/m.65620 type:complete len:212 (-) Transcript_22756:165-800(-)
MGPDGRLATGRRRPRALGLLVLGACACGAALVALRSTLAAEPAPSTAFAGQYLSVGLPRPRARPAAAAPVGDLEQVSEGRAGDVAMRSRWIAKEVYGDGWRFGGRNMWLEDQMGGNWMNISVLKTYTFPSGRLKPRVMTKLRQADHKRAIRYIKRLRHFGLMPFHRIQAHVKTDPDAQRPMRANSFGQNRVAQRFVSGQAKKDLGDVIGDA